MNRSYSTRLRWMAATLLLFAAPPGLSADLEATRTSSKSETYDTAPTKTYESATPDGALSPKAEGPTAESGTSDAPIDYSERPNHVYIAQADDWTHRPNYGAHSDGYNKFIRSMFHTDALNGGLLPTKIRVQAFDDAGRRHFEFDLSLFPGHRTPLVDPMLPSDFEDGDDVSATPTVFIVSSEQPLRVSGYVSVEQEEVVNEIDALGTSQGVHDVDFELVDCNDLGNGWICAQWHRFNNWSDWVE